MDSFGYNLPAEDGLAWSRFLNEELLKACDSVEQLAPLATVLMQNGEAANFSEEEQQKILGSTAAKIFGVNMLDKPH